MKSSRRQLPVSGCVVCMRKFLTKRTGVRSLAGPPQIGLSCCVLVAGYARRDVGPHAIHREGSHARQQGIHGFMEVDCTAARQSGAFATPTQCFASVSASKPSCHESCAPRSVIPLHGKSSISARSDLPTKSTAFTVDGATAHQPAAGFKCPSHEWSAPNVIEIADAEASRGGAPGPR